MDFILKLFFEIFILGVWSFLKFMFNAFLGLIQILVNLQYQRFFTLLLIIFLVWCDLCLIAPKCSTYLENFIHFFILFTPFIYLSKIAKKGEV